MVLYNRNQRTSGLKDAPHFTDRETEVLSDQRQRQWLAGWNRALGQQPEEAAWEKEDFRSFATLLLF